MIVTTAEYLHDPEALERRLQGHPSCEEIRWEVLDALTPSDFQQMGEFLNRFPDLRIFLKDLSDSRWTLHFLEHFPQTRSLELKCLWSLESLAPLSNLSQLQTLEIGSILNRPRSLQPLLSLFSLKKLILSGDWQSMHQLESMQGLETLGLIGCPEKDLTWISGLASLRTLSLMDGRTQIWDGWSHPSVERLELIKMRHLTDLRGLEEWTGLQHLLLKSLPRLEHLPAKSFLERLQTFKAVHVPNSLGSFSSESPENAPKSQNDTQFEFCLA